jgi:hypothetical protein
MDAMSLLYGAVVGALAVRLLDQVTSFFGPQPGTGTSRWEVGEDGHLRVLVRGREEWTNRVRNVEEGPLFMRDLANVANRAHEVGYREAIEDVRNVLGAKGRNDR